MPVIENRTWKLPTRMYGQRICVHAGKRRMLDYRGAEDRLGAILGEVTIVNCVQSYPSKWFFGPYGFVLEDPVEYATPISCKGALGFFAVPADIRARIDHDRAS